MIRTISREELRQKIDNKDDFVLVETLPEATPELLPDKNADIVVYCAKPS